MMDLAEGSEREIGHVEKHMQQNDEGKKGGKNDECTDQAGKSQLER